MMITASIVQPNPANGIGYWPGFWLIAPQGPWPGTGEMDIMEDVNAGREVAGTLHCGNLTQHNADGTTGPCHEGTGLTSQLPPCPDCQSSYNTYSLVIDRRNAADESVTWYINGNDYFTVHESQVGAAAWAEAIDHSFAIILDVALGGGFPERPVPVHESPARYDTGGSAGHRLRLRLHQRVSGDPLAGMPRGREDRGGWPPVRVIRVVERECRDEAANAGSAWWLSPSTSGPAPPAPG